MTAVSTMILNSLVATGEKAIGGSLTSAEETFYLNKLNAMLESWSIDRALVYAILQESFSLTAGTASYTIGSGGTFNTTRPVRIVNAFTRDTSNYDNEIAIIPQDRYAAVKVKTTGNGYPEYLYYDGADVAGLATIYIYPAPIAGLTLYINSYQQMQSFANVSTALVMPVGYQRAIESNFSLEILPGFAAASPELVKIAKESKAAIKGLNLPDMISTMDSALTRSSRGSILNGP
jgi:hypothetical protein